MSTGSGGRAGYRKPTTERAPCLLLDALACDLARIPPCVSQSDQAALELLFGEVPTRFTAGQPGDLYGQREQIQELAVAPLLFVRVSHGRLSGDVVRVVKPRRDDGGLA